MLNETEELKKTQLKRKDCFEKYQTQLIEMRDKKGPGQKYRRWLYGRLNVLADTLFETEQEEYENIGKFGRGIFWNVNSAFKAKEEKDFIKIIAEEYGAFNY